MYIPLEDLLRFDVSEVEFMRGATPWENFAALMKFEADRARRYFNEAAPLVGMIHRDSRASLKALIGVYSTLLDRIVESNYDVLARRIRVPTWQKMWLLLSAKVSG